MRWLILMATVTVTGLMAYAQETIKVNVETVQVYATVTDLKGRFVTDLTARDFKVVEDGKEQHIDAFSSDDSPLSVGILFDSNGDMGTDWEIAKQGALAFLKVGNLGDDYFVIEYNDKPKLTEDYTSDIEKLQNHAHTMGHSRDNGAYDAIYAGLEKLRDAKHPRKVLLVFTSGGYLKSQHGAAAVRTLARQLDVQVYGITSTEIDIHGALKGRDTGETVIDSVGGETFTPDDPRDFPNTCRK